MRKIPIQCPSCQSEMHLKQLHCPHCHTEVSGDYPPTALYLLTPEEQDFLIRFVKSSGSLKQMSQQLGLSYPTVRNLLDNLISKLQSYDTTD